MCSYWNCPFSFLLLLNVDCGGWYTFGHGHREFRGCILPHLPLDRSTHPPFKTAVQEVWVGLYRIGDKLRKFKRTVTIFVWKLDKTADLNLHSRFSVIYTPLSRPDLQPNAAQRTVLQIVRPYSLNHLAPDPTVLFLRFKHRNLEVFDEFVTGALLRSRSRRQPANAVGSVSNELNPPFFFLNNNLSLGQTPNTEHHNPSWLFRFAFGSIAGVFSVGNAPISSVPTIRQLQSYRVCQAKYKHRKTAARLQEEPTPLSTGPRN